MTNTYYLLIAEYYDYTIDDEVMLTFLYSSLEKANTKREELLQRFFDYDEFCIWIHSIQPDVDNENTEEYL